MLQLSLAGTPERGYLVRSHWSPEASPLVGFFTLPLDTLSSGARLLARHGHPGPWRLFLGIAVVGALALAVLVRRLAFAPRCSHVEGDRGAHQTRRTP